MFKNVKIAITSGDPAGIGPEVSLKALLSFQNNFSFTPVLIANLSFLNKNYSEILKSLKYCIVDSKKPTFIENTINIYDINPNIEYSVGMGNEKSAKESIVYIDKAISLWKNGLIDAIATAPVNKGNIEKNGIPFIGHTEYFAEKIDEKNDPIMMMYSEDYRVALVTTHCEISKLPSYINYEKILYTINVVSDAISKIDGKKTKIAVCGLDPHCGDNGAIGLFDKDITSRVIKDNNLSNCIVEGPFAADTIFMNDKWIKYDAVIAMYHDQGLIPFKMIAFEKGVNVTLGMKLIRTSADHGTAFDIAGQDIASFESMKQAMLLAEKLCFMNQSP